MKVEFKRFRLTDLQRKITGFLQILGGISLLVGFVLPIMGVIAAAGLSVQMLLGFVVRLKVKDGIILSLPSFIFMLINTYLFIFFLMRYP